MYESKLAGSNLGQRDNREDLKLAKGGSDKGPFM